MFEKFLNRKLKTDEPLDVTIYTDGRTHVTTPEKPTLTQASLLKLFKQGVEKGAWNKMNPGQYKFHFTKIDKQGAKFSLVTVEEYSSIT